MESRLDAVVVAQAEGKKQLLTALRRGWAGLSRHRPRGVALVVGPPGVGRTTAATLLAETLYEGPASITDIALDDPEALTTLADAARRRPASLFLLRDPEKATRSVQADLARALAEGTLLVDRGAPVSLEAAVVVLVSALGTDLHFKTAGRAPASATLLALAGSRLVPALWSTLDGVALFAPLSETDVVEVLARRAATLSAHLQETRGVSCEVEPHVRERLAANSVADRMRGATVAVEAWKREVEDAIAAFLLAHPPRSGSVLRVGTDRHDRLTVTAG